MIEALTQARDCAGFVVRDLRAALGKATALEALLLLPMISEAVMLERRIAELLKAAQESAQ